MNRLDLIAALFASFAALGACGDRPAPTGAARPGASDTARGVAPPYDFLAPDAALDLDDELTEISALSMRPDGRLAAVHDEEGIVYTLDPATGAIVGRRRFARAGDFEGVEWAEGATWILRSNGSLYALPDSGGVVVEYNTPLRARCDAEGLTYDPVGRDLIVMCKERVGGEEYDGARGAYSFDLATRTLSESPVLLIARAAVDAAEPFKPAALTIHPSTREIYVISSVRKAIAVLDARGALLSVTPLPAELYPQPEGLAFAPDGTLYISNEGVDGPATLLRFDPRP